MVSLRLDFLSGLLANTVFVLLASYFVAVAGQPQNHGSTIVPNNDVCSSSEPLEWVDGEINLAPSIARLQRLLLRVAPRVLGDEKIWVDRPVRASTNDPAVGNPIEKLIIEIVAVATEEVVDNVKIRESLDKYLFGTEEEVETVHMASEEFRVEPGSRLFQAFQKMERFKKPSRNGDGPSYESLDDGITGEEGGVGNGDGDNDGLDKQSKDVIEMAKEALSAFRNLYRSLKPVTSGGAAVAFDYPSRDSDFFDRWVSVAGALITKPHKVGSGFMEALRVDPREAMKRGRSSLLSMPRRVLIPGGRFVEAYYWDTYWIIRGLLVAGKVDHARDMIINFLSCIDRFGFVPNGFRRYYLDRSQPPLLNMSVKIVLEALRAANRNGDADDLLKEAFPRLLSEYFGFWMNPVNGHVINVEGQRTGEVPLGFSDVLADEAPVLNRYYSLQDTPRPESLTRDEGFMEKIRARNMQIAAGTEKELLRSIRAAAESGWDFSVRWSRDHILGKASDTAAAKHETWLFSTLDTTQVIPVDLNAIMFKFEKNMEEFSKELVSKTGDPEIKRQLEGLQEKFRRFAARREKIMQRLMTSDGFWWDYYLRDRTISKVVSAAGFVPIWAGVEGTDASTVNKGHVSRLVRRWGVVPTHYYSTQQWDAPNVWPPLTQFAIQAFDWKVNWDFSSVDDQEPRSEALDLARKFVAITLESYRMNKGQTGEIKGYFYEKYHCDDKRAGGHGGEYANQLGFGWTNGVILETVARYAENVATGLD